jgi:hypothetical protein
MRNFEPPAHPALDLPKNRRSLADAPIVEQHMRRQEVLPPVERPNVEVVDIDHPLESQQILANRHKIRLLRRAFKQHVDGLAHDAERPDRQHGGDDQGEERIDPGDARPQDRQPAEKDSQRSEGVAENMDDGRARIQIAVIVPMPMTVAVIVPVRMRMRVTEQHKADGEVEQQADRRHGRHDPALRHLGYEEAAERGDRERPDHCEEEAAVRDGGEHLHAREAEALPVGRRPLRLETRRERDRERQHVHRHMRRIGEQREAMGDEPADSLEERERQQQQQRDEEPRGPGHGLPLPRGFARAQRQCGEHEPEGDPGARLGLADHRGVELALRARVGTQARKNRRHPLKI